MPRPKAKRHDSREELLAAARALAERALANLTGRRLTLGAGRKAKAQARRKAKVQRGAEARVAAALLAFHAASAALEATIKRVRVPNGPLSTWAHACGLRSLRQLDGLRIPEGRPAFVLPETAVKRLVFLTHVERRDLLGLGRVPNVRELAWLALTRGYEPTLSGWRTMTPGQVVAAAERAVREVARDLGVKLAARR